MVSPETTRSMLLEKASTMAKPRISFSADFLDDDSFISITPGSSLDKDQIDLERSEMVKNGAEFEFLSSKNSLDAGHYSTMSTADELFFEGKLLPYSQINHAAERLTKLTIKASSENKNGGKGKWNGNGEEKDTKQVNGNGILLGREVAEPRIWFVDDDPSPRPPKCTVLWKELLRLKKQRSSSTLSPSSSSSSSSSSNSLGDAAADMEEKEKEKHIKRVKKGLERSRSGSIRIRPMFNVPISTQTIKSSSLPPLFPLRKNKHS